MRIGISGCWNAGCLTPETTPLNRDFLPLHLDRLQEILERHPDMRVVIDHCAKHKHRVRQGEISHWAEGMCAVARGTHACCKLWGMVTEAGPNWRVSDIVPYADVLLEGLGPERLILGSDWPVCAIACDCARRVGATCELLGRLGDADRDAVLGGNAVRARRLQS